jgi:3'-phosphoadenosine 5'-phosphosulfate sulfotransferase (PAPS reductase)/FAD synthetase
MFNGHKNVMLQFSGGKDSLACLWLLEMHWPDMIVAWVNTGDAFPETLEQMETVKKLVPHFLEIKSNQPEQIKRAGYPVDLLPVWDTELGRVADTSRSDRYQTPFSCCGDNIWIPLANAVKGYNVTLVIRGQRSAEAKKSPIRSGHTEDGVQYWFPIEDWTDEQVLEFLGERLPAHYKFLDTSLDCQHCTAYMNESKNKLKYARERHVGVAIELERRLFKIYADCTTELGHVRAALGET